MNKRVMEGHLLHEIADQERRVSETLIKAFDGAFNGRLRCTGLERCTPQEDYEFATNAKTSSRTFELAPSDIYLCRSTLTFDDKFLTNIHLYLLHAEKGSIAQISKIYYSFRPTISDKVICPEGNVVFVRLDQYRMNIMQFPHPIVVDGKYKMDYGVVWGQIHKSSNKAKASGIRIKAKSCLVHYLLGHYGFTKLFQKFVGTVPVYGTTEEITEEHYPKDKWHIIRTAHQHAKSISCVEPIYQPVDIAFAIPKGKWSAKMISYMTSVFYILDSFPSMFKTPESLEHINTWRLTLGQILFNPSYTVQRILSQVEEHFNSSDTYMDSESVWKLHQNGYKVNDFHDLLALLVSKFNDFIKNTHPGMLYGKYLDTLRDVVDPIIKTINRTKYVLMELELKNQAIITPNKVRDCIVRNMRTGAIFDNNRNNQLVEVVSSCTDHPYFKMTSRMGVADRSPGMKTTKGRITLGPRHYVTTSKAMVGSLLNLSKHNPILESHINPWIITDPVTNTVLEDPAMKQELAEVDIKLSNKRGRK